MELCIYQTEFLLYILNFKEVLLIFILQVQLTKLKWLWNGYKIKIYNFIYKEWCLDSLGFLLTINFWIEFIFNIFIILFIIFTVKMDRSTVQLRIYELLIQNRRVFFCSLYCRPPPCGPFFLLGRFLNRPPSKKFWKDWFSFIPY